MLVKLSLITLPEKLSYCHTEDKEMFIKESRTEIPTKFLGIIWTIAPFPSNLKTK